MAREREEDVVERRAPQRDVVDADAPVRHGSIVSVTVRERRGTIVEAVRRLDDAGVDVDDLTLRRPTLDDVFLTLTGHAAEEPADPEEVAA